MTFLSIAFAVFLVGFASVSGAGCKPNCPKCPPLWTFYDGHCYRFFGATKTFREAEKNCQRYVQLGEGHLVSLTSKAEEELVYMILKTSVGTLSREMWNGLNDEKREGTFVWTDGSDLSYSNWASRQPDNSGNRQDCVCMRSGTGWNDVPCTSRMSYVCKMLTTK
ncbi:alpha-N-acetylgalactosamine-specific lectin-like [Acanthaster planci]|uniref:Alpha-N-acetylgalactosamine-specific lectin-like n=1 Tax=Acanthaster planci TaxID=133434 RepID=A0A8B7YYW4_ACAPL|nr:alpha-N-acetylgalactosamine-specific lectin-like [Acanthaster planci]